MTAEQAAQLLRMQPKRVRRLAREGRLPAARVGRRWLFRRADLERLLGAERPALAHLEVSARNRLRGRIASLRLDGLMGEVVLAIGDQQLVAIITRSSVERMGLRVGGEAFAVVKATEVMIGVEGGGA